MLTLCEGWLSRWTDHTVQQVPEPTAASTRQHRPSGSVTVPPGCTWACTPTSLPPVTLRSIAMFPLGYRQTIYLRPHSHFTRTYEHIPLPSIAKTIGTTSNMYLLLHRDSISNFVSRLGLEVKEARWNQRHLRLNLLLPVERHFQLFTPDLFFKCCKLFYVECISIYQVIIEVSGC